MVMFIFRRLFNRRIVFIVLIVLSAGLFWLANTAQPEVAFARHVLWYRAESWWGRPAVSATTGQLSGTIYADQRGIARAMIIVSDHNGRVFTTMSDATGHYQLTLPVGAYVPVATCVGFQDEMPTQLGFKQSVAIQANHTSALDFTLRRVDARTQSADNSLAFFDDAFAHAEVPQPMVVRRRGFTFVRAGKVLTASYVYEPLRDGVYPMLLMVYPCSAYPCSTLSYDILSATMAAQGFVVVTFSPQRGLYLEDDTDDLIKLLAHIKTRQLSQKGNVNKLGILTGSLTSIHVWRLAQLNHDLQAIVTLGGVSDIFLLRQRFEEGALHLEPKEIQDLVEYALIGLGRPNTNPEMYVRYSVAYHVDALPRIPIAIMHGVQDKIVPFEQTPHLSKAMSARNIPHDLFTFPYEHYLQLSPPTPAELDMLDKVTTFLRRALQ
jgi:hypothetical protein